MSFKICYYIFFYNFTNTSPIFLIIAGMASGVPSFIKQSFKFEDICRDEEDVGPIDAPQISRIPPTASIQEKSTSLS